MSAVIRFTTSLFDVTRERPNPINPIFGESLLAWLRQALAPGQVIDEPQPEDWGWCVHIEWSDGRRFMLGASASDADDGEPREWVLQVVPQRSFKERLLGRGKMTSDHPLVGLLVGVLTAEAAFAGVSVESVD